jgi:hypothetical protein
MNMTQTTTRTSLRPRRTSLKASLRTLVLGAGCLVCVAAQAQWQWLDKDGRKVYSDRAPPADVLEKSILKRPGNMAKAPVAAPADAGSAAAGNAAVPSPEGTASAPKLSGVDKELAEKKKQAADAEAAKRKAEEEKITKAKIENCARAKQSKATLDSGVRIGRTNEKGEREIMEDAARAAETKRVQAIVDTSCK